MSDAATFPSRPPPAHAVLLSHEENDGQSSTISLRDVAARLATTPAHGSGVGSRVWRFAPLAMAQDREERPGDIVYALKWVNLSDAVRTSHLVRELDWLARMGGAYFPVPVTHAMLRPETYLLVTEWIEGRNLAMHAPSIVGELVAAATFERFCGDLIRILERLQAAGISHGDIWEPNIIVRDQRPVLIDFGWARPAGEPPARDNFHQPDDERAIHQMLLRLGALRRMVTQATPT